MSTTEGTPRPDPYFTYWGAAMAAAPLVLSTVMFFVMFGDQTLPKMTEMWPLTGPVTALALIGAIMAGRAVANQRG